MAGLALRELVEGGSPCRSVGVAAGDGVDGGQVTGLEWTPAGGGCCYVQTEIPRERAQRSPNLDRRIEHWSLILHPGRVLAMWEL